MRASLFVNPRSGSRTPSVEDVVAEAEGLGIRAHVLEDGDDLAQLARSSPADILGVAGGDGSVASVAAVAIERDIPLVCLPLGTRNHFAGDAGLPLDDPLSMLAAFADGVERRVDVGRADGRLFLNNVSLGVYARLVHRRERRRRRGELFARLRAVVSSVRDHAWTHRFLVDGVPVEASVLLVGNNEYRLDLRALGARDRIDEGTLALYAARGLRRLHWTERTAEHFLVEARRPFLRAAVDGEPARFESPLRLWVEPRALRLRLLPGGSPSATAE